MNTQNLKNTIKAISKIVKKRSSLAIIENVEIENGFIYATNLEIYAKLALCDESLGSKYSINFAEFKKAAEMFENITYLSIEDKKVVFDADGANVKYLIDEFSEVFNPLEKSYKLAYKIGSDLPKLETAIKFVSKDELRPQMLYVAVNNNHIVSTNANYLYFDPIENKTESNILIKPEVIKIIKDLNTTNWEVYESDMYLKFTDGSNIVYQVIQENKFPDWQCVIPRDSETHINANKKELITEIKKASNFNLINTISLNANGCLKIEAKDEDLGKEYSKELKEYRKQGIDLKIGFNANYLTAILSEIEQEYINFEMSGPTKGVLINRNFLLMPVLIG
jgi:DNA polymerase-3 subunit beta